MQRSHRGGAHTCKPSPGAHTATTTLHAAGRQAEAAAASTSERAALCAFDLPRHLRPACKPQSEQEQVVWELRSLHHHTLIACCCSERGLRERRWTSRYCKTISWYSSRSRCTFSMARRTLRLKRPRSSRSKYSSAASAGVAEAADSPEAQTTAVLPVDRLQHAYSAGADVMNDVCRKQEARD